MSIHHLQYLLVEAEIGVRGMNMKKLHLHTQLKLYHFTMLTEIQYTLPENNSSSKVIGMLLTFLGL